MQRTDFFFYLYIVIVVNAVFFDTRFNVWRYKKLTWAN